MNSNGAVDVIAEIHLALVAVEKRRIDVPRQGRREEKRTLAERSYDFVTDFARLHTFLRQLLVVFRLRRLMTGRDVPIHPSRTVDARAKTRDLLRSEDAGNVKEHVVLT
jgi:hypothetical protein